MHRHLHAAAVVLLCALALGGCQDAPAPVQAAAQPAEAVRQLADRLRHDDLVGFSQAALPPALLQRVEAGWRTGHTRWPLDELPLDDQLPDLLRTLSAPGAEAALQAGFRRQFAGAGRELRQAAGSLGLFAVEYLRTESGYSAEEQAHYIQAVEALSRWGERAPLDDPRRARQWIGRMAVAARRTGIDEAADFHRLGLAGSLRRLGPFLAAFKQANRPYGLDLDAALDSVQAELVRQTGDAAVVRLRYRLAGSDIDTLLVLQRVDGRWYLRDFLRNAAAPLPLATGRPAAPRHPEEAGSP